MKKFLKFCGTLAMVLAALGLVLFGVGMVTVGSGSMNEMLQKLTDGRMQMDFEGMRTSLENALERNALYDIDDVQTFDDAYEVWVGDVEKTMVSKEVVENLNMELGGCMFEVKNSEDASIYVEYKGNGKTQAFVEENELHIKVLNVDNWNSSCMTLYLPIDTEFDEIDLELGAGQMNLNNLKAGDMEMNLGAGQVLAEGLRAENVVISVGAGDVTLEQAKLGTLKMDVGAGNCEIGGTISGNVEAECAMGNISFKLTGEETDFNYVIQCVTGNITIVDKEYSGVANEQNIDNQGGKTMDIECAMGNVEVAFE